MTAKSIREACAARGRVFFNICSQPVTKDTEPNTKKEENVKKCPACFWTDEDWHPSER